MADKNIEPTTFAPARDLSSSGVIANLQILRFVAAAMVLIDHLQYEVLSRPFFDTGQFHGSRLLFWAGGVDIFFVISGFIMYIVGKDSFNTPGAPLIFLSRRAVRIVPLYWLFTFLMLLSITLFGDRVNHSNVSLTDVLGSLFFIPYVNAYGTYYPVLSLGWTLNFEFAFYALYALALLFKRRVALVALAITLTIVGIIGIFNLNLMAPFGFWFNSIVIEFLFGIGLAILYVRSFRVPVWLGLLLAMVGFTLVALASQQSLDISGLHFRAIWMGIPALLICAGLVLIRVTSPPNGITKIFVFGGNISFALYLSHPFTMNAVALVFDKVGWTSPTAFMPIAAGSSLMAASCIYLFFERPVTTKLNQILKNHILKNGAL